MPETTHWVVFYFENSKGSYLKGQDLQGHAVAEVLA